METTTTNLFGMAKAKPTSATPSAKPLTTGPEQEYPYESANLRETSGTWAQGKILATYNQLVNKFGEPSIDPGQDACVFWAIRFHDKDNTIATIYLNTLVFIELCDANVQWQIGGFNKKAPELVMEAVL